MIRKFDEIQAGIRAKYPDFKSLSWWTRLKVRFNQYPSTHTDTLKEGMSEWSQTYKTFTVNGKIYFWKFGW